MYVPEVYTIRDEKSFTTIYDGHDAPLGLTFLYSIFIQSQYKFLNSVIKGTMYI